AYHRSRARSSPAFLTPLVLGDRGSSRGLRARRRDVDVRRVETRERGFELRFQSGVPLPLERKVLFATASALSGRRVEGIVNRFVHHGLRRLRFWNCACTGRSYFGVLARFGHDNKPKRQRAVLIRREGGCELPCPASLQRYPRSRPDSA